MRVEFSKTLVKGMVDKNVREAFLNIGKQMVYDIRSIMQPGSGRVYIRDGGRVHEASAPGEPPAKDYKNLAPSISFATSFGDKGGGKGGDGGGINEVGTPSGGAKYHTLSVGSDIHYALDLEVGLGSVKGEPRPYLAITLKNSIDLIKSEFQFVE